MTNSSLESWHPIASSRDLPLRHVYHGQLLGQEFAVWRADDGNVNAWQNRCLHRGVRLSIGINDGAELKCQYHGWRYANRTAACTYIPAHPADAPARRISSRTYPVVERFGLVWSAREPIAPFVDPLPDGDWLALRPLPVDAAPGVVLAALTAASLPGAPIRAIPPLGVTLTLAGAAGIRATFFVQPVDSMRASIRGLVESVTEDPTRVLRLFNHLLTRLRSRIEAEAADHPRPAPIAPIYEPVPPELATMPDIAIGRGGALRAKIVRKWTAAEDVTGLELAALSGTLPSFQPGAHIDLHLPNGLIRQYSLTNGPGEWRSYTIGVKRDPASRGGSRFVADTLREGDVVALSEPRNNFPLRRDAIKTILIAGGIGVTPLLAMAKTLERMGLGFEFHAFARSAAHVPFAQALAALGAKANLGLDPGETERAVSAILDAHAPAHHVYVCGPGPMLEMVRARATAQGWPETAVHFEYFGNSHAITTTSTFTVELARSALTLAVPAGKSILQVLRDNGVEATSSCEQGACGTCLTGVIAGIPDHQDVYLNESEKAANRCLMTCVSRSLTDRLVLDI